MRGMRRGAQLAAGVIALAAWVGLVAQFQASLARQGSAFETAWVMLRYFTVISNLLVAISFTALALGGRRLATPFRLAGVTLAMLLVGIVYHLLLRGMLELSGGDRIANALMHSILPVLVPVYWLIFAERGGIDRRDPWRWALLPLVYFLYALVRGAREGVYAYPFMNVPVLGWTQTLITALVMALAFVAAGFAMLWLDRALSRPATKPA